MKKPRTLFDHLAGITSQKTEWNDLNEVDQKSFSPYLINRWLSMHYDLIEVVDAFQQYTIGPLDRKHVYQLYHDILPEKRMFAKYIKGKKKDKYDKELVKLVAEHGQVSQQQAESWINIWLHVDPVKLRELLIGYGIDEKQIDKWLK